MLRCAGMQVYQADENGKQYRISMFGGHYGSAIDGVVVGCPDLPDPSVPLLLECKTHNDKSFAKLRNEGVFKAKIEHFAQMQQYCGHYNLIGALYVAINKNDDNLYMELVEYDKEWASYYANRSHKIIFAQAAPERYGDPSCFECRFCNYKAFCHYGQGESEKNCRTCKSSIPREDGTWVCGQTGEVLDKTAQEKGCDQYDKHPDL
jgi:hypothetical protein